MNTLIHADIFFFVSSVGFVILAGLLIVALVYVIGILRKIKAISQKIGDDVQDISADTKAFIHDIRESGPYRLLFKKRKK